MPAQVQRVLQNGSVASLPARMDELVIGDMVRGWLAESTIPPVGFQ
jgi:hypothetical protein